MSFKATRNWLINHIWRYLFIGCFSTNNCNSFFISLTIMKFSASTEKSLKTVVCVRLIKLIMKKIN